MRWSTFQTAVTSMLLSLVARLPYVIVTICIALFCFIGYDYVRANRTTPATCYLAAPTNINMTLVITPSDSGKLSMRGHGYLNTDDLRRCKRSDCKVLLNYVAEKGVSGTLVSAEGEEKGSFASYEWSETVAVRFKEDNQNLFEVSKDDLPVETNMSYFPFEEYRVEQLWPQFITAGRRTPMQITVRIGQPTLFSSRLEKVGGPYSDGSAKRGLVPEAGCKFIIHRQPWYRAMVILLVILVCSPLVYILCKEDSTYPGLQLITAIIGVAAIRGFLLGKPTEGVFYLIDFVFVAIMVFTAMVPLWRLGREGRRRRQETAER